MKKNLLTLLILFPVCLNAQSFQWAKQYTEFIGKLTSHANGTYATGSKILAAKLDEAGKILWSKSYPSSYLIGNDIKLDSKGNIYVAGVFYGTSQIGDTTIKAKIGEAFVAKMDSLGEIIWLRQSTSYNADAHKIYLDANEEPIVCGYFSKQNFSFGGQSITCSGSNDGYVMKLSVNGNLKWIHAMGGQGEDRISHILPVSDDKIYLTGYYTNSAQFGNDPAPITNARTGFISTFNPLNGSVTQIITDTSLIYSNIIRAGAGYYLTAFGEKGLLIKTNESFEPIQTAEVEGGSFSTLALAPNGTIMVGGAFYDNCKIGAYTFTCKGESDFFLAQYAPDGTLEWAIQPSGPNIDIVQDITYSAEENLFYILGAVQSGPVNLGNIKVQGSFSGAPFLAKSAALPVSIRPGLSGRPSIKVYPNPADDFILVELKSDANGVVELFSLTGHRLVQIPLIKGKARMELMPHYTGVYIVKVSSGKEQHTQLVKVARF